MTGPGPVITATVALALIVAGLAVTLAAETVDGARLIGGPVLALAGLALLVRLAALAGGIQQRAHRTFLARFLLGLH